MAEQGRQNLPLLFLVHEDTDETAHHLRLECDLILWRAA